MLRRLVSYSYIYEVHMSPALNGSSVIRRFEHSDVIEICDEIIFDFYTGLSHMHSGAHCVWGLFFMYCSLEYVIFTSCNLHPLRRVILCCNVGWCVKGSAVHHRRQQSLVAEWLGLSVTVRVRVRARARGCGFSVLFFCCLC